MSTNKRHREWTDKLHHLFESLAGGGGHVCSKDGRICEKRTIKVTIDGQESKNGDLPGDDECYWGPERDKDGYITGTHRGPPSRPQ